VSIGSVWASFAPIGAKSMAVIEMGINAGKKTYPRLWSGSSTMSWPMIINVIAPDTAMGSPQADEVATA